MRSTSGSRQRLNPQPKRQLNKIATNMIELSNIQYLLKFVNYVSTDPTSIFQNSLNSTQHRQPQTYFTTKLNKFPQIVPFIKFSEDQILQKQQQSSQIVKNSIRKSLQAKPPSQYLSKQEILHLASSKIMEGKLQQEKEIAKSRRSFEYIQNLKTKIISAIDTQQQQPSEQQAIQLNQIIKNLQILQEKRAQIKLQLYQLQKQDIPLHIKLQTYKLLEQNLFKAKQFYTLYLSQVQMNSYIKAKILNSDIRNYPNEKQLKLLPDNRTHNIMRLEKFLNSILIDKRELNIIRMEFGII